MAAAGHSAETLNKGVIFMEKSKVLVGSDTWFVQVEIDLDTYKKAVFHLKTSLIDYAPFINVGEQTTSDLNDNLQSILNKEKGHLINGADNMLKILEEINFSVQNFAQSETRSKRSLIDAVGHGLKFLFGTAMDQDVIKANQQIQNLSIINSEMIHIVKQQTTIFNLSYSEVKDHEIKLEHQNNILRFLRQDLLTLYNNSQRALKSIDVKFTYFSRTMQIVKSFDILFQDLSSSITALKQAFMFASLSKLDKFFLPPVKLLKFITEVQNKLPHGKNLLGANKDSNLQLFYSLAQISAYSKNTKLILFIKFPLYDSSKEYTIYQALPLPTLINNNSNIAYVIKSKMDLIAISKNLDNYFLLTLAELNNCLQHYLTLCTPYQIIKKSSPSSDCLYQLFIGTASNVEKICTIETMQNFQPHFYRISTSSKYVYSVSKQIMLHKQCELESDKHLIPEFVSGVGFLKVPASCTIHGAGDFILHGSNNINMGGISIKNQLEIPKIVSLPIITQLKNHLNNISIEKYKALDKIFVTHGKNKEGIITLEIQDLLFRLDNLHIFSPLTDLIESNASITWIFFFLFILLSAFLYYAFKIYKKVRASYLNGVQLTKFSRRNNQKQRQSRRNDILHLETAKIKPFPSKAKIYDSSESGEEEISLF